jgi:UPF0042 nucleotide-binding protein
MKQRPIIIVTGTSGSGKTTALAAFEDAGFYCIDNMPIQLVAHFLKMPPQASEAEPTAGWVLGMDLRDKGLLTHYGVLMNALSAGCPGRNPPPHHHGPLI